MPSSKTNNCSISKTVEYTLIQIWTGEKKFCPAVIEAFMVIVFLYCLFFKLIFCVIDFTTDLISWRQVKASGRNSDSLTPSHVGFSG